MVAVTDDRKNSLKMLTLYVLCLRPPRYLRGKPVISAQKLLRVC